MTLEEIFKILESEGLKPRYIKADISGFSRWIEFETKYQKCWIEWYANVCTLRVGDIHGVRIPFTSFEPHDTSPSNEKSLLFTNKDVTPNFGLADWQTELTLQKLDWQEN